MSVMKYKGYTARIDFDARDNIFVGRVLGVRSIVGFHGDTVAKLGRTSMRPLTTCWRKQNARLSRPKNLLAAR
jgi:predicted HicB family RNase H-like nuclease